MDGIYRELVNAQETLSALDSEHELLGMVRVEEKGVFYQPSFLRKYCDGKVVDDDILRRHIGELDAEAKLLMELL